MNSSKNLLRLAQTVARSQPVRNAATEVPSPRYKTLKATQAHFGVDDGVPVHLKGGYFDRVLLLVTYGLVITGTLGGFHTIWTLVQK